MIDSPEEPVGELKKRIKQLGVGEACHDSDLDIYEFEHWVDEAKKDYPTLTSLGLSPQLCEPDIVKLLTARNKWFARWFGK